MKRKTNLFYNSGADSKFLTFSNYTEALTGNFLSTNTKLFPSSFICLNIPSLTAANKEAFIKNVLISKYENKLATLRDIGDQNNVLPLQYLLEHILVFDANTTISYIGNITEQDYMGSYTDTICIIDTLNMFTGSIDGFVDFATDTVGTFLAGEDKLYGWYENGTYLGPSTYSTITPAFDKNGTYRATSNVKIKYNATKTNSVEFNVLIPLFKLVDITGNSLENSETELIGTATSNVPLGIWFADKTISLVGDSKYGQTWSLAIGSQFKPLPTSSNVLSDITSNSNTIAFNTFAQILSRQNEILDMFSSFNTQIEQINKQILNLSNRPIDTELKTNINKLTARLDVLEQAVNSLQN